MSRPSVHRLLGGSYVLENSAHSLPPGMKMLIRSLTSSVALVMGESVTVFDTGTPPYRGEILSALRASGVDPNDVEYVVLSHGHQDHFLNCSLFPEATVITEPNVKLVDGCRCEVFTEPITHPDWQIVPTPGHMAMHLSLLVHGMWKGEEKTVVMAGDAFREDLWRRGYYHGPEAKPGALESARWVLNTAEVVIPGHFRVLEADVINELRELHRC